LETCREQLQLLLTGPIIKGAPKDEKIHNSLPSPLRNQYRAIAVAPHLPSNKKSIIG
jgi:predicted cobalt transporter CbtA